MESEIELDLDYRQYIEGPFVKGILRVLVLSALKEGEKHGYQVYQYIINKIKLRISLSTIYTVLKELTERGFVTKAKNVYRLTEKGWKALRTFIKRYHAMLSLL